MKAASVSSHAVSQALRHNLMRMQSELVQRQKEMDTGRVADPGVSLGARVSSTVSMNRDIERLKGLEDSNALAANRLSASQDALGQITALGEDMMSVLTASSSGVDDPEILREEADRALESLTSLANTSFNGDYLFAGINTDIKPLNDFSDPDSPNREAFDDAFQDHFGFARTDPQAGDITGDEMTDFLDNVVEPMFMGGDWDGNWSNASDERIVSRIALNETAETSVTANGNGIRKLAMVTSMTSSLLEGPLNGQARQALQEKATTTMGEGLADIADLQAEAGIAENRVEKATERVTSQVDVFNTHINDLEGVDPFEAATRVSELLTQIETSYALTARIQQLSLIRHLP